MVNKVADRLRAIKEKGDSRGYYTDSEEKEIEYLLALDDKLDLSGTRTFPMEEPYTQHVSVKQSEGDNPPVSGQGFRSFGEQLIAIRDAETPGRQTDPRLFETRAPTGLGESSGDIGGFLLQTDYQNQIFQQSWDEGKLAKLCNRITLSDRATSVKIPAVDETSRVVGSRQGGVRAYFIDEAAEKTASKPKFRQLELIPQKLVVLVYVTDELFQDVGVLGNFVANAAAREIAFWTDDMIINGTGVGQPLGILNAGCLVTQAKETAPAQPAATILGVNCAKMVSRLLPGSYENSVWLVGQDSIPEIWDLQSLVVNVAGTDWVGGSPVMVTNVAGKPQMQLYGRPIIVCEQCQTLGTAGDIILADLKNGYFFADKGAGRSDWSIHVRFVYDEMVFRLVYRFDGQPALASAVTPFKGSSTMSHFVNLVTRS